MQEIQRNKVNTKFPYHYSSLVTLLFVICVFKIYLVRLFLLILFHFDELMSINWIGLKIDYDHSEFERTTFYSIYFCLCVTVSLSLQFHRGPDASEISFELLKC